VRLTQILCPVDLSECSRRALDHALALARSYHAHLTVMEVRGPLIQPMAYPAAAGVFPVPMVLAGDVEEIREGLRRFAARASGTGVRMDLLVREGAVVPSILNEARTIGADLIGRPNGLACANTQDDRLCRRFLTVACAGARRGPRVV